MSAARRPRPGPAQAPPRAPGHTHPHSRLSRLIWSATTLSCSWYSGPPATSLALPFRAAISRTCWTKASVKRKPCRISVCSCCGARPRCGQRTPGATDPQRPLPRPAPLSPRPTPASPAGRLRHSSPSPAPLTSMRVSSGRSGASKVTAPSRLAVTGSAKLQQCPGARTSGVASLQAPGTRWRAEAEPAELSELEEPTVERTPIQDVLSGP